jgi:integrase
MEQIEIQNNGGKKYTQDFGHYKCAGQLLIDRLGANFPAATITSDNMFDIRDYFNDLPSQKDDRLPSRQYVNKVIGYIKAIFRWGVKKRLIRQAEVLSVMDAIKPIESGEGNRETIDRREISDEVVNQMIPYLTPQLHAMIQTQGMYGFRPSEVCNMKVRDFDFTHYQEKDGYVIYLLKEHKTARYGESFEYFFYKRIMDLIFPYLKGKKPDDYVFPPKQHLQELRERAAAKRKSKVTPSQLWRKAVAAKNPKEIINDHWEENNYNRAISNAIKAANKELPQDEKIPHFTLYQLRYGFVSRTSETDGTDRAQTCVGHKTNIMTRHYDKSRPNVCKKHFKDLPLPFATEESESVKSEESESEKSESINAA